MYGGTFSLFSLLQCLLERLAFLLHKSCYVSQDEERSFVSK